MNRKLWLVVGLLTGSVFLIGFFIGFGIPKLKTQILLKIEKISREDLPIRILPGAIDINFLPLSISLSNVQLIPKEELKDLLEPFSIGEVRVQANLFKLMTGKLTLQKITVRNTVVRATIPPSKKKTSDRPLEGIFENLNQVPVNELVFEGVDLKLKVPEKKLYVEITDLTLSGQKYRSDLGLEVDAESIYVVDLENQANLRISSAGKFFLTPEKFIISHFKVQRGSSTFNINGVAQGEVEALNFPEYDMRAKGTFSLESLSMWAKKTLPNTGKFPKITGDAEMSGEFKRTPKQPDQLKVGVTTKDLKVDKFVIGDIDVTGELKNHEFKASHLSAVNNSVNLNVEDFKLTMNDALDVTAKATIKDLSLHELLLNLGLKELPLWLKTDGQFDCASHIKPSFYLQCSGSLDGHNLGLKPEVKDEKNIVVVNTLSAVGALKVDLHELSYDAKITAPNSRGTSEGKIVFDEGFQIKYGADRLSFADVADLVGLKIEGNVNIAGETNGDSRAATMSMQINGKDMWLSDFSLGQAKANISYAKGRLSFNNVQGAYPHSNYQADVALTFPDKKIAITGKSSKLDADDLLQIFNRKVKLPFQMSGTGAVQAKIWGPLAFNQLSYDLKSTISHGNVWREPFDTIYFDIHARDGEVVTDRVQMERGPATVSMTGVGHPDGNIDVKIHGQQIRLEDSAHFQDFGLNITSFAQFDMALTEYVLKPNAELNGTLTKTSVADQAVADSKFHLRFRENTVEGQGSFMGEVVHAEFITPLKPTAPFALKLFADDWNFAPLFASLKIVGSKKDFASHLTGKMTLAAENGGFWNSNGTLSISKFDLSRGALQMASPRTINATVTKGQFNIEQFSLEGQNTSLKIVNSKPANDKIDWQINGKLDMNLIALLLPFFEELRGELSFSCNLKGNQDRIDLLGSAFIDHGYLKLFDFVHPIEEIKADILFNKKKVLLNSMKADFAGGQMTGEGSLDFVGEKNIPFKLNANIDKVTLRVPDGVLTKGSGKMSISGTWLPFLLKGTYVVDDGLVTKEFGGGGDSTLTKSNQYLPKDIYEENQSPLNLDLDIDFNKGLPIKNSQIEGKVKGQLSIKGTPQKPSIIGTVTATPESKIKFNEKPFEIVAANFTFDDPSEINPKMYINARTHLDSISHGPEYDINLVVQGTAQNPKINLTSLPVMTEPDIISLLALGTTATNIGTNVNSSQQGANTSFVVGSAVLQKNPLGKELKDRFNVDLQFTSGFDETNNIAVQKISLSGKVSDKIGWVYNRSIGTRADNEAQLKYRLTDRFSLVGDFLNRATDETDISQQKLDNPNTIGLDLEYRFQFK